MRRTVVLALVSGTNFDWSVSAATICADAVD
jgi:hypothetical protein